MDGEKKQEETGRGGGREKNAKRQRLNNWLIKVKNVCASSLFSSCNSAVDGKMCKTKS